MRVLWLDQAEDDRGEIFRYLIGYDIAAALRTYEAIREQAARLGDYPNLGRPGRILGTRELPIGRTPYLVVYTVDRRIDAVIILRVVHGARLWPSDL